MEKNILFPKIGGFVHGGDYNPEQWLDRPDILEQDILLMKKAGINCVTLGVFSWSYYEPVEGEFHFGWMEKIMNRLYDNGIYTILATPSGARPAWLDAAYPEAMRVGRDGVRNHHGVRHNHCMASPKYREKVSLIDRKLAERFGTHPGLLMWHISNELGGECYCPLCVERFQRYLEEKFDHNIEKLNHAWWTTFWSHRYNSFHQIEPPFSNGEGSIMGLNLEWKRFTTFSMNDFMETEIAVIKEITPDIPVTTNFMRLYNGLDYRKMSDSLDVISWDSYPYYHNDYETLYDTMADNAFQHAIMRSMKKDKPFMLMESAPGLVNWHAFNKLKRPGVHRLACLQAVACGSDTVQYFQWRKGRGSFEQYHGAVLDHLGRDDTRIFREVEETGAILQSISQAAGTLVKAKAALLFDWDNRWAIQDVKALSEQTKNYEKTCINIWKEFLKMGVEMDIIPSDGDLADYEVIVAPMLYLLQPETAAGLKAFVGRGGQLLVTYFTGYVDENQLCYLGGFPGDGLADLFGVISEEIDTLYPSDKNRILFDPEWIEENQSAWRTTQRGQKEDAIREMEWDVKDYVEILRVKDARVLAEYQEDFYRGSAAVTCKTYTNTSDDGNGSLCGRAYYVGARVDSRQMNSLFRIMLRDAGIPVRNLPEGVEYHVRTGEEGTYQFYLNCTDEPTVVQEVWGTNLVCGKETEGVLKLEAYGTAVIRR